MIYGSRFRISGLGFGDRSSGFRPIEAGHEVSFAFLSQVV